VPAARRLLETFALPLCLVGLWWFGSVGSGSFYFPPLSSILDQFWTLWTGERFAHDVVPSLFRLGLGYALAGCVGIALGIIVGLNRRIGEFLEPTLEFLRAIPPSVLVPIFMIVAGLGTTMKVLVIVSGSVWPILLNTIEGVRTRDEVMEDVVCAYRIRPWMRLVHFVLPAASPLIFAGLRQALSIAIILMVISEMFAASDGIGFSVVQFQRSFAIPEMWSGIIVLGLIGICLSSLFRFVERHVLAWHFGLHADQKLP
jgi:ABC-type nitrate/sulfonate/bicarbonate transport system permease component